MCSMEENVFAAIKDGANIRGYTSWSLLDKFEWDKGYTDRYGFYYAEFNSRNKPRYPKASVQYYKKIIIANGFPNAREVGLIAHAICSGFRRATQYRAQKAWQAPLLVSP